MGTAGLIGAALPARAQTAGGLVPLRLSPSEIFKITVCLRPFRATGPRIEAEKIGGKTIIHNYGHGGSGWSLSWGSAAEALRLAPSRPLLAKPQKVAVIGAGAIGLTQALAAQRAGMQVTIYARERYPFVRSGGATGSWTPDSRVALTSAAPTGFADQWERMARRSWTMHNAYLGLPGAPVEWMDHYHSNSEMDPALIPANLPPDPGCVYLSNRLHGTIPRGHMVDRELHPFNAELVNVRPTLIFNIAAYAHQLEQDFLIAGGRFVPADFASPKDVARLPEKVIFNCTGYGARTLWSDETILPVRGQIAWLPPQADVHYGFRYKGIMAMARRDGIIVQQVGPHDGLGWNDANEAPDIDHARLTVAQFRDAYRVV
ncbi:hypothetical protein AEYBE204_06165 [Asticcacaulis sp. YBE204]|nr:hypothetical protein AEYBE204_06165 [Asticcacaulis sp. YBE204]